MTRAERERQGVLKAIDDEGAKAHELIELAEKDDRDNSPEEDEKIREHMKAIGKLEERKSDLDETIKLEAKASDYGRKLETEQDSKEPAQAKRAKSLGEQFTENESFKRLQAGGFQGSKWSTGPIDLELGSKATLTELATSGGDMIPQDWQAGVTETLYQPLTVADLLASGTTSSNTVRYVEEVSGSVVNAADSVAEGGTKPESTLVFNQVDEPVQKIATFLPVSDEMLEDVAQIQSYINQRLSLFVRIQEEAQLLSGTGTPPDISGITDRAINSWARGTVDSNAVALFKAANGGRGSSFLEPDAIVMNPANWQTTRLGTDSAGQFFGGGPFLGPYGGPQGPTSASQFSMDQIWGLPVHVTSAIGAGTALVGSFRQGAQVYRRSGLTVEASNSHDNYFRLNLTAIRAEERLALAVYRPAAFTQVTGLN